MPTLDLEACIERIAMETMTTWYAQMQVGDAGDAHHLTEVLPAVAFVAPVCEKLQPAAWLMRQYLADTAGTRRKVLFEALARFSEATPEPETLLPLLCAGLGDANAFVRARSAAVLAGIDRSAGREGLPALARGAATRVSSNAYLPARFRRAPAVLARPRSALADLRENAPAIFAQGAALAAVSRLGAPVDPAVKSLFLDHLDHPAWFVGAIAAEGLLRCSGGSSAVDELKESLRSGDREEQLEALRILGRCGSFAQDVDLITPLLEAAIEPDLVLRAGVIEALGSVGGILRAHPLAMALLRRYAELPGLLQYPAQAARRRVEGAPDRWLDLSSMILDLARTASLTPSNERPVAVEGETPNRDEKSPPCHLLRLLRAPRHHSLPEDGARFASCRKEVQARVMDQDLELIWEDEGLTLLGTGAVETLLNTGLRLCLEVFEARRVPVRVGVYSGQVALEPDGQGLWKLTGSGVLAAEGLAEIGDPGHFLVSDRSIGFLPAETSLRANLHDLGVRKVRGAGEVHVHSLHDPSGRYGSSLLPEALMSRRKGIDWDRWNLVVWQTVAVLLLVGCVSWACLTLVNPKRFPPPMFLQQFIDYTGDKAPAR